MHAPKSHNFTTSDFPKKRRWYIRFIIKRWELERECAIVTQGRIQHAWLEEGSIHSEPKCCACREKWHPTRQGTSPSPALPTKKWHSHSHGVLRLTFGFCHDLTQHFQRFAKKHATPKCWKIESHVMKTVHKYRTCRTKWLSTFYPARRNVTTPSAQNNMPRLSKHARRTGFEAITNGTAICCSFIALRTVADGCERFRTVENGCERLRSAKQPQANTPPPPDPQR